MSKKQIVKRRKVEKEESESDSGSSESSGEVEQQQKEEDSSDDSEQSVSDEGSDISDAEIEDDELIADSDDDEEEEDVESEEEADQQAGQKRKRTQNESFSTAISAILGSKVKAHDRANPILARSKKTAKELEASKLEAKAKRALTAEKKELKDKDRVKDILPKGENAAAELEYERQMKQTAKRGVVRLFNAILGTQNTEAKQSKEKVLGATKKEEQVNEMSKESFLDLIRSGGK